jgi:hypothetical protein
MGLIASQSEVELHLIRTLITPRELHSQKVPDESARILVQTAAWLPDLSDWEQRPRTQIISEKSVAASPYVGGSNQKPRDIRTLRRWRKSRRGPSYLKIGGRYFYTIGALRDFFARSVRAEPG